MPNFKVKAEYKVSASSFEEAELLVEQGQALADEITSEPATKESKDVVSYGLSKKVSNEHSKLFFDLEDPNQYQDKKEELIEHTIIWIRTLLEEILAENEARWS